MATPQYGGDESSERSIFLEIFRGLLPATLHEDVLQRDDFGQDAVLVLIDELLANSLQLSLQAQQTLLLLAEMIREFQIPAALCAEIAEDLDCTSVTGAIDTFWTRWYDNSETKQIALRIFEARPAPIFAIFAAKGLLSSSPSLSEDISILLRSLPASCNLLRDPIESGLISVELGDSSDRRIQEALGHLALIQQLSRTLSDPYDLPALLSMELRSVEQIAYSPLQLFASNATEKGISEESALRIHSEAVATQLRSEQLWTTMLQAPSSSGVLAAVDGGPKENLSTDTSKKSFKSPRLNLSDWFGDMDEVGCAECCSVTSPAAYYLDLLRMLKNQVVIDLSKKPVAKAYNNLGEIIEEQTRTFGDADEEKRKKRKKKNQLTTLLDCLFHRRPDLGDLLLSCRNTTEIIPYIDLVNEVLESAVLNCKVDELESIDVAVHNADTNLCVQADGKLPLDATNVRYEIYDKYISKEVSPSRIFPYSHSLDCLRTYLGASGTSLATVLRVFLPERTLQSTTGFKALVTKSQDISIILRRALAAETLHMTQTDYVAITSEAFWDLKSARLVLEDSTLTKEAYQRGAGLLPIAEYWGYKGEDAEDEMLDKRDGEGLVFIKKNLLPKLQVDFTTLVEILKTRFLDSCLQVSLLPYGSTYDKLKNVPSQLNGFRLVSEDGVKLSVLYHRLGRFVRLWQRLGWSIAEVDDAIVAFGVAVSPGIGKDSASSLDFGAETIEQFAAIQDLIQDAKVATKLEPRHLISLWSTSTRYLADLPISLASNAAQALDNRLGPAKISEYLPLLLTSLDMGYDEYIQIQKDEKLEDLVTMRNIYTYNRIVTIAKIMGASVEHAPKLLNMINPNATSNPVCLANTLRIWDQIRIYGWDAKNFIELVQGLDAIEQDSYLEPSTVDFVAKLLCSFPEIRAGKSHLDEKQEGQALNPGLVQQLTEQAFSKSVPNLSAKAVNHLLHKPQGDRPTFWDQAQEAIKGSTDQFLADELFSGALLLRDDAEVVIKAKVGNAAASITLETQSVQFDGIAEGFREVSCSFNVAKDKLCSLNFTAGLMDITISTLAKEDIDNAPVPIILNKRSLLNLEFCCNRLKLYQTLLTRFSIQAEEMDVVDYICAGCKGFDMLMAIHSYAEARKQLVAPGRESNFVNFVKTLTTTSVTAKSLIDSLSSGTKLSTEFAERLLNANFPGYTNEAIQKGLGNVQVLKQLGDQVAFLSKTGLKENALDLLFAVSKPSFPIVSESDGPDSKPSTEFALVQMLRATLVSKSANEALKVAQDSLRVNRRQALVSYLLQQPAFVDRGIFDADHLFEFFLIDVSMGTGLDTSRIKQAISTVQLFVHRCCLGLEPDVDGSKIDRNRWEWMQKYRLWEANRKVFLYPENWADPTLRETKTPLFRIVEDAIGQSDLDDKVISQLIRSYVYGADEIANLRIEAYYWDNTNVRNKSKVEGSFHFFARTRYAPYQYYYRKLDYFTHDTAPITSWTAWDKVPFDIRSIDVDVEGRSVSDGGAYLIPVVWRKRLLLFLPQFSAKVSDKAQSSNTKVTLKATKEGQTEMQPQEMEITSGGSKIIYNLELHMSWTEFADGKWTAPKQTQDVLVIEGDGREAPDYSAFRFVADSPTDNISIQVTRCVKTIQNVSKNNVLGKYELQGSKLAFIPRNLFSSPPEREDWDIVRTSYSRFPVHGQSDIISSAQIPATASTTLKNTWPDLARPPIGKDVAYASVTWTLDSAGRHTKSIGLVADVALKNGTGQEPYFTLPGSPRTVLQEEELDTARSLRFFNSLNDELRKALAESEQVDEIYRVMDKFKILPPSGEAVEKGYNDAFGRFGFMTECSEDATAYSIYNWEIGFHLIALLLEKLVSGQQVELALQYARLVFDPTGTEGSEKPIWRFPPFRDPATRNSGTLDAILDGLKSSTGDEKTMAFSVSQWRKHPFQPHAVARGRPLAYMKRFTMKYLGALIASGDKYFRQDSLETLPLAIQRYVEAAHIFGPAPQKVPELGTKRFKSYNEIQGDVDDFSNVSVDIALAFPYYVPLDKRGYRQGSSEPLQGFPKTRYFGVQGNPELSTLRNLIDDRLYKIRNSLDINGNRRSLSLFDPPIDPGVIVKAVAGGKSDISSIITSFGKTMPKQRSSYYLQKTLELCAELKQAGNAMLTVMEKRDGEAMQSLRAKQDATVQRMLIDMKLKQRAEFERGIEQLLETRRSAEHKMGFYIALTGDDVKIPDAGSDFEELAQNIPKPSDASLRLTYHELTELHQGDMTSMYNELASKKDWWAALWFCIPMPSINAQPMGIGMSIQTPNFGQAFQSEAAEYRASALQASEMGSRASRIAQWTRQLQERRLQINLAGREIKSIDKQIEAQKARLAVLDKEVLIQQETADNAVATEEFLRSKFTNQELYAWMEQAAMSTFYQTYALTMELARKLQKVYQFENGMTSRSYISASGYWDSGRRGLQAGEKLWLEVKQMEMAYMESNSHDFELVKTLSLRRLSPDALVNLRELGEATYEVPETLFDLDFPGHYFRRIQSVRFSFHCILSPYTGVNCVVSLLNHRFRFSKEKGSSYAEVQGKDPRFTTSDFQIPVTSAGISSGQHDSGVFDLSFQNEKYRPFEGAGVISKWRLRLPSKYRQFDYRTISDVTMQIQYTARDGGEVLRESASDGIGSFLKSAKLASGVLPLAMMLDIRNEYPSSWFSSTSISVNSITTSTMELGSLRDKVPYYVRNEALKVISISVYTEISDFDNASVKLSSSSNVNEVLEVQNARKLNKFHQFDFESEGKDVEGKQFDWNVLFDSSRKWSIAVSNRSNSIQLNDCIIIVNYKLE